MEKITKVSQLLDLPVRMWPRENYPRAFEDIKYPEEYAQIVLELEDIEAIYLGIKQRKRILDFWDMLEKNLEYADSNYFAEQGKIYRLPITEEEKARALQEAQGKYEKAKINLYQALRRERYPWLIPKAKRIAAQDYIVQENLEWSFED